MRSEHCSVFVPLQEAALQELECASRPAFHRTGLELLSLVMSELLTEYLLHCTVIFHVVHGAALMCLWILAAPLHV
jgi:hypothetical protein